jgi:hypothetical protein
MMEDFYDEDEYSDDNSDITCERCKSYQDAIYRLNFLLREAVNEQHISDIKARLDAYVQIQLEHQREHI